MFLELNCISVRAKFFLQGPLERFVQETFQLYLVDIISTIGK